MGLEKRTVKIIFIVAVNFLVIAFAAGTVVGVNRLLSQQNSQIKLDIIPRPGKGDLIYYRQSEPETMRYFYQRIDDFLSEYHKKEEYENRVACAVSSRPQGEQVCDVPVEDFFPCTAANKYNFEGRGGPCIFLKLNKVLDWVPQPYNSSEELPADMPIDLREHIKHTFQLNSEVADTVWVSCEGETMADKEHMGPIMYIPRRGFPGFYYPFTDKKGYLSPLVAVLFERPQTGVLIAVECKAWAKNIDQSLSLAHLELMIDP